MGKTADIRATGALRFFDVVAVKLGTGLSEVSDLIVVGLPCILVSNCKYQLTCSWRKQNWLTCEVNGVVSCWLIVILIYLSLIGQLCMSHFGQSFPPPPRCLQYLLHPPYPYMPVHLKENYKQSPSWYQTSWKTKYERERYEGSVSPSSADVRTPQNASGGDATFERSHSDGAKKPKKRIQSLKVSSDDLWRVREKLDGKKRSLGKTYKTSKETNDKVYALNQKTGKYLETPAILYENVEHACTERKEAEEQFDKDFHELLEKMAESRSRCVEASAACDKIEKDLNEGLGLVRNQFEETVAAKMSLTVGTADRSTNEVTYLQEALDLLNALLLRGTQEEGQELGDTEV